ncbi:hypothetical protein NOK12_16600 [Nocardioides sp. OK12]|uniref:endonuclease VII domain-containing protein n=1 Tax=Nocardioides sp. OK12 TaxID=2758661 RepID=UPI0021C2CE90|nr:endonuclease VII domain-containing protein [Nocardioides sp. OK12]GHJ59142.1 hypothetical protein NOK12_16600 [Nocardioides sp. OK12]
MTSTPEQRAKRAAYVREWNARPENRERVLAQRAQRRAAKRDEINAAAAAYREGNRAMLAEKSRAYKAANPEVVVAYRRATAEKHADRKREMKYGLRPGQFAEMLADQGGRCAICRTDTPNGNGWQVDHCHDTGDVRGILCHSCNVGIGHLKDNPAVVEAALNYLRGDSC